MVIIIIIIMLTRHINKPELNLIIYRGVAGGGEWVCRPWQQNPRGGNMNILKEKNIFSALNKF